VNPPLDSRTWIVLPFENVARASDLDWLRDGSANLLYLDLSRWSDIRVIDDERVADLLREQSFAPGRALSLTEGLAIARRAGARQLVMGDVLRAGSRVALVAKVFDASDGKRLRSVREEVAVPDSMFAVFSKLARSILDVAPPTGANVGALRTVSVDAYKEYLAGVRALNAFDLPIANWHLGRAVELDSTFALAHYKLAMSLMSGSGRDTNGRRHAERALRLSGGLPSRERTLIKAYAFFPRDYAAMCATLAPLVRADSSDVDALYGMADCLYHDNLIVPTPGDSTRFQFRGSWNESFRLFRRVLELDPTYHLAYQHVVDGYLQNERQGRPLQSNASWMAFVQRQGDSLHLVPMPMVFVSAAYDSGFAELGRSRSRERNLRAALAIAREWIAAAPAEPRAHRAAARAHSALGELAAAEQHLRRGMQNLGSADSMMTSIELFDLSYRQFRFEGLSRFADSLIAAGPVGPDLPWGAVPRAFTGRFSGVDSIERRAPNASAALVEYRRQLWRAAVGLPADSAVALEQLLPGSASTTVRIRPSLSIALRAPRTKWPAFDSASYLDLKRRAAAAIARNDTASLRLAARALDSAAHAGSREFLPDRGFSMVSAESYLALQDSVNALKMVRWVLDTAVKVTPFNSNVDYAAGFGFSMPRIMLLRADLAAAMGRADEARVWYKRLLDLWANADPEFQPLIDRIRRALLALGAA